LESRDGSNVGLSLGVRLKVRWALQALKGLVKLQALVRGHNVWKQANMTLRCMQELVRVQARVRDQHMRLAQESSATVSQGSTKSSFNCDTSFWEPKYLQELAERRSMVTNMSLSKLKLSSSSLLCVSFLFGGMSRRGTGVASQLTGTTAQRQWRRSKRCCRFGRRLL
ncbi:unnamed protein product, partial [Musa acuminata subsp. burmannicoides]